MVGAYHSRGVYILSQRLMLVAMALVFAVGMIAEAETTVWYVDVDSVAAPPDGASWATAFPSIQAAIDAASGAGASEANPAEVWVAEGAYTGSGDNVVEMAEHVHLYGGFMGTETERAQRDWDASITAIDGEETRRCVLGANSATLDGFSVTRGDAFQGGG